MYRKLQELVDMFLSRLERDGFLLRRQEDVNTCIENVRAAVEPEKIAVMSQPFPNHVLAPRDSLLGAAQIKLRDTFELYKLLYQHAGTITLAIETWNLAFDDSVLHKF